MKVLFLTKYDVRKAGVAEVLQALAKALRPLGVDVFIYSSHRSAGAGPLPDGTDCACGPLPRPGLLTDRKALGPILERTRQWEIDLIHAHGLYRSGWAARLLGRATGLPYVVTSHGDILTAVSRRARRGSFRRRCRKILRDAAAVTHLTTALAEEAMRLCGTCDISAVIPNGVDLTWWQQPAEPVPGCYALALGRFVTQKGFDVLLSAWPALPPERPSASLVLAGEGKLEPRLRARATELHLSLGQTLDELAGQRPPDVVMPGFITGQLKRNLFAGAALVAFPSQSPESFGMVLAEAIAAGKAIVASDLPFVRSLIAHETNGLIVPAAEPAAWTAAIHRLLDDRDLRRRIEHNNRRQADRYDWPPIARQYSALYRQVLAGG